MGGRSPKRAGRRAARGAQRWATRLLCGLAATMGAGVALVPVAGAQTLSDDASLSSLSIESDIARTRMFPAFQSDVTGYDVAVPNGETEVTLKVAASHSEASLVGHA